MSNVSSVSISDQYLENLKRNIKRNKKKIQNTDRRTNTKSKKYSSVLTIGVKCWLSPPAASLTALLKTVCFHAPWTPFPLIIGIIVIILIVMMIKVLSSPTCYSTSICSVNIYRKMLLIVTRVISVSTDPALQNTNVNTVGNMNKHKYKCKYKYSRKYEQRQIKNTSIWVCKHGELCNPSDGCLHDWSN